MTVLSYVLRAILPALLLVAAASRAEFESYNPAKGYCGPGGSSVPEFLALFNEPCYGHDKCYNQCKNTKTSKATCDDEFRLAMKIKCDQARSQHYDQCTGLPTTALRNACKIANKETSDRCYAAASAHYLAVKNGADLFHSYNCTAADLAPHQPSLEFQVNGGSGPVTVAAGGYVTLSWSPRYVAYCTASDGWSGSRTAAGGSARVGPVNSTSTYTLTCSTSAGASASKSVRVNVTGSGGGSGSGSTTTWPPSVVLTINGGHQPAMVPVGGSATLSWNPRYIAQCTASGGWSGSKRAAGGTETVGPINQATSFTLTCRNSAGDSASRTVEAQVFSPSGQGGAGAGGPAGGSGLGSSTRRNK